MGQAHQSAALRLLFGAAACLCPPVLQKAAQGEDDLCLQQIGQRKQPILLVYFKQMYNCCNDMLSMCFSRSDLILQEIPCIYLESHVCERLSRCLPCPRPSLLLCPGKTRQDLLGAFWWRAARMKQCIT